MGPFIDGALILRHCLLLPHGLVFSYMIKRYNQFPEKPGDPDPLTVLAEGAGWTKIVVPASRAGDATSGMDRAQWCLDNFGACAITAIDSQPRFFDFDDSKLWAAGRCGRTRDQIFFFKDERDATLFRICRG